MEREKGLEPSTFAMATRRSSQLSYSRSRMRVGLSNKTHSGVNTYVDFRFQMVTKPKVRRAICAEFCHDIRGTAFLSAPLPAFVPASYDAGGGSRNLVCPAA